MARILSLTRSLFCHCRSLKSAPLISLSLNRNLSFKPLLIEIDLGSSSSSSSSSLSSSSSSASAKSSTSSDSGGDLEIVKRMEDMIYRMIVKKCTPDWLPFIPGSSFWVPPRRRSYNVVDLFSKLKNELTEEESLSLATLRGWPCSSVLLKEATKAEEKVEGDEVAEENRGQLEMKVWMFGIENNSRHED